jgi:hypothetical protein
VVDREVDEVQGVADLVGHSGGQAPEGGGALREVKPLLEETVLPELLDHLVEGAGEARDLVASRRVDLHGQVARGHPAGCFRQLAQRAAEAPCDVEREEDAHREHGQGRDEAADEGLVGAGRRDPGIGSRGVSPPPVADQDGTVRVDVPWLPEIASPDP